MAGDIKTQYVASVALTVTNLHSLASSNAAPVLGTGWTSASINNTTNEYLDILLAGTFTTHASNRQAGYINTYIYAALNDTPDWQNIFSAGTEGTEGTATVHDTEHRDCGMRLISTIFTDTDVSGVYTFPPTSVAQLFGGFLPPYIAIFVSVSTTTTTTAGLASSGSALYYTPVNAQFT